MMEMVGISGVRNNAVSITRGIGIVLMVLAHSGTIKGYAFSCVYLFHMPLFFMMSGVCFKDDYLDNIRCFARNKFRRIYVPCVKYGILFLLMHNFFFRVGIYNNVYGQAGTPSYIYDVHTIFRKGLALILKLSTSESLLGGYWFLYTLFFASFIYLFARKIIHKELVAFAFLMCITFFFSLNNIRIPIIGIGSREFMAALMISVGHMFRRGESRGTGYAFLIISGLVLVLLGGRYWSSDMNHFSALTMIPFLLTSYVATVGLFSIAQRMNTVSGKIVPMIVKFLTYAGDHSLSILTWHFLFFKVVSLLYIKINGIPINHLAELPTINNVSFPWNFLYFLVGVSFPLIFVKLYDLRYLRRHINRLDLSR